MLGKSKKFSLERYAAILDFFLSLEAPESQECRRVLGHTLDYHSTINSLAEEGLLKRYVTKRATGGEGSNNAGEDLNSVSFKCNFDYNFIDEVSRKIDF